MRTGVHPYEADNSRSGLHGQTQGSRAPPNSKPSRGYRWPPGAEFRCVRRNPENEANCRVLCCLLLFTGSIMLAFAHIGITLGAATLLTNLVPHRSSLKDVKGEDDDFITERCQTATVGVRLSLSGVSWLRKLRRYADVRFILVGSLLPDIIDKPVGQVFFRETFSNGRIFSHSLLFVVALGIPGIYLYRRYHNTWLSALTFGSLMHLVLDKMWQNPQALLWPFRGLAFQRELLTDWLTNAIMTPLTTQPAVYVPELVGLVVIAWFIWVLLRRKTVFAFLRYGQIR
jgi:inner membrane protein